MPANVETAAYANTPAWHREGVVLDTEGRIGMTVEQALEHSGLDWEVEKQPCFIKVGRSTVQIPERFAVVRTSDNKPMGVVGSQWTPVQNQEGFAILDDLITEAGGEVHIEAAGALNGGRRVWVLARLAEEMVIAGDAYHQFILFSNGHDGRTSVTAAMTNVRVVCANTEALALETATRLVRVRHTATASDRIKEARNILGLRNTYAEELARQGEWLVKQEMSNDEFDDFLAQLMSTDAEPGSPADTMVSKRQDSVRRIFRGADNLETIRNTRWGALQAVIEYADHGREFQSTETQLKAQFGFTPTPVKDAALQLLVS